MGLGFIKHILRKFRSYLLLLFFLTFWQVFVVYIHPKFNSMAYNILPSPWMVVEMGAELLKKGQLLGHIWDSTRRVLIGFSLAVLLGVFLGSLMGSNMALKRRLKNIIIILRSIPPFAWIPLGLIWLGVGEAEVIMIIVLSGVFPVAIHTLYGIDRIDIRFKEAALSLGVKRWQLFFRVVLPGLMPELFLGMRQALGFCWVVVVGAEMVGSVSGLGYLILDSRNRGLPQMAILGMILVGVIGFNMDRALIKIKKLFLPWDYT